MQAPLGALTFFSGPSSHEGLQNEKRYDGDGSAHHQNENEGAGIAARALGALTLARLHFREKVHYDEDDEGGDEELHQITHRQSIPRDLV